MKNLEQRIRKVESRCGMMVTSLGELKIRYGSKIIIGDMVVYVNKHFNAFQKKMIKWCFGFEVKDCNGEV